MATREHAIELSGDDPHIEYFQTGSGIGSRTVMVRRDALEDEPFDEGQPLREDPELWTRLLADIDAERIPEPLAVKRRRSDSISSDPDAMYEAEMREIDVLCERFPELEQYREQREFEATFRYGRELLRAGDIYEASDIFADLLNEHPDFRDYRIWACYAASFLPFGLSRSAYRVLQRAQEAVK